MAEKIEFFMACFGTGVAALLVLFALTEGLKRGKPPLHVAYTNMRLSDGTKVVVLTSDYEGTRRFQRAVERPNPRLVEQAESDLPFLLGDSSGSMASMEDLAGYVENSLGGS